ncbi:response regulator transcription factor [Nocardioides sp. SYSU D00038]|uniref:response regulator transcription factor n=1 Tax=Nocardioides sp. SYSU D00038 TaxID=2812554 RepID=UPI00196850F7|nr:response regulator transcription factor [Nocardioides sp. SYSU D00038]
MQTTGRHAGPALADRLPAPARTRVRVGLASDQPMVLESVRAALAARGLEPVVLAWPDATDATEATDAALVTRTPARLPDAAVLLSELDAAGQADVVRALVADVPARWLVLSREPRGPGWGAALAEGADAVLPVGTDLATLVDLLDELAAGRPVLAEEERQELLDAWHQVCAGRERTARLLTTLSRREREVLELLDGGASVRSIALEAGVAETTVRSQVRAVLRKLGVGSQLAAVAQLRWAADTATADGTSLPG